MRKEDQDFLIEEIAKKNKHYAKERFILEVDGRQISYRSQSEWDSKRGARAAVGRLLKDMLIYDCAVRTYDPDMGKNWKEVYKDFIEECIGTRIVIKSTGWR